MPLAVGDIQALAERCAKVEFAKEFLYEFSGNRTLPIGSIPGEPVTAKESFQRVSNPSHTDVTQKLQDWVDGLISRFVLYISRLLVSEFSYRGDEAGAWADPQKAQTDLTFGTLKGLKFDRVYSHM